MTILVQDLGNSYPTVFVSPSISDALELVSGTTRCQLIDLDTGIIRLYNENYELIDQDKLTPQYEEDAYDSDDE